MDNRHALIIDDNINNLEVLSALLASQGFTVMSIKDPTKVIGVIHNAPKVDIIFCDLEMPKVDGYALLPTLRAHVGPEVPIISCTVHTAQIDTARKLGFDGFLGKPLDADRFPAQLARILNSGSVWEL